MCAGDIYEHTVTNCTQGPVWIITEFKGREIPEWVQQKVPVCLQKLSPCKGRSFWEGRMRALHKYLSDHTNVSFAVVSDDDILVNSVPWEEVMARFQNATAPNARVLLSTEQTCWTGKLCAKDWAQQWLDVVRNATGYDELRVFLNSQYMGERDAVIGLLDQMIALGMADDQAALHAVVAQNASTVSIDYDEQIFLSLSRGFVPRIDGDLTCNFGGKKTRACGSDPHEKMWGRCRIKGGSLWVAEHRVRSRHKARRRQRVALPVVLHLNSHAMRQSDYGRHCRDSIEQLRRGNTT